MGLLCMLFHIKSEHVSLPQGDNMLAYTEAFLKFFCVIFILSGFYINFKCILLPNLKAEG